MKAWYLIAVLSLVITFLSWRLAVVRDKMARTDSVLSEKTDSIRYWKSRSGKTVATKTAAEVTPRDLKEHYQEIAADLRDMKVKLNSVRAVLKAVVEANGQGVPIIIRDTVRIASGTESRDSLFVNDGYLDFRSSISFTEDAGYKYLYQDTILWAAYDKKKWLLGNEKLYADFRLSNPNARALNMTSVLIRQRDKRFVISAGVSYDPFGNRFVPAVHAGYALFKF